jgi:hypothetical protein
MVLILPIHFRVRFKCMFGNNKKGFVADEEITFYKILFIFYSYFWCRFDKAFLVLLTLLSSKLECLLLSNNSVLV